MKQNQVISVAIADENPIYRNGLRSVINSVSDFSLCFEVNNGIDLIENLHGADPFPDVCIMDLSKHEAEYYSIIRGLKDRWINLKILAMSESSTEFSVIRMINFGVNGFLSKGCEPCDIEIAVRSLVEKGFYYSSSIPEIVFRKAKASVLLKITVREMEFLMLCCTDLGYKNIADKMCISIRTIESYRDSLYDKLNVKSRMGLMIFAIKAGIIPADKLHQSVDSI